MAGSAELDQMIRDKIIADPDALLEDRDVMRALAGANGAGPTGNVVDIRGVAIERLENRLDRLEDTHKSVIAAAYENLAGTNQVHRATLALMDAEGFDGFLKCLETEVKEILNIDAVRLILETRDTSDAAKLAVLGDVMVVCEAGFIANYVGVAGKNRQVTLRRHQRSWQ